MASKSFCKGSKFSYIGLNEVELPVSERSEYPRFFVLQEGKIVYKLFTDRYFEGSVCRSQEVLSKREFGGTLMTNTTKKTMDTTNQLELGGATYVVERSFGSRKTIGELMAQRVVAEKKKDDEVKQPDITEIA